MAEAAAVRVGLRYLLDSVILIDHLNGRADSTDFLAIHAKSSAISVITRAEVLVGYDAKHAGPVIKLLDAFENLPIDTEVAERAAALRREHRWKLPDAFQAALAAVHKLELATRNTDDFPPRKFKWVVVPY